MFFTKVGEFSKEEFELANKLFSDGKNPHYLYVYFKKEKVDIDDVTPAMLKVRKLKKAFEKAEQIYNSFESIDKLLMDVKNQLDLIIPEIVKSVSSSSLVVEEERAILVAEC